LFTHQISSTVAAGTFSGFIVDKVDWPVQYWYNIGFEGLVILLCLLWLDETGWTRNGGEIYPTLPPTKFKRKLVTYFFAGPVMPQKTFKEIVSLPYFSPFSNNADPLAFLRVCTNASGHISSNSIGWILLDDFIWLDCGQANYARSVPSNPKGA
jgi:hypothetical protein